MWPLRLRSTHADTSSSSRRTVARGWPSSGRAGAAARGADERPGYSRHSFTATGSLGCAHPESHTATDGSAHREPTTGGSSSGSAAASSPSSASRSSADGSTMRHGPKW